MEFLTAHGPLLLFYLFGALALGAAVLVVTLRSPVYGAISLLVSFLSVSALFLLRQAPLLFAVQVFVYGGGIMVLFLFVIMLVNLHRLTESRAFFAQLPAALLVAVLLAGMVLLVVTQVPFTAGPPAPAAFETVDGQALGNTQAVAWLLYRDYLLPFEVASLFLLVAMVGAVVLGRRG